ncbi:MAG: CPBP family intramembrane metalloprotease [Bacteroidales bacterium]|nr:CPBP family intramembrane metalloprotease [Bacteroidales bacterium]
MLNNFFEDTKPRGQLLALALIFVLFFILSVILSAGTTLAFALMSDGVDVHLSLIAVTQIVSFAGAALFFAFLFYEKPLRHLGLPIVDGMFVRLIVTCVIILCLLPMSDWLGRINDAWHLPQGLASFEESLRLLGEKSQEQVAAFLSQDSIGALMGNLIVMALVPAFCEELFFRGALQQLFCRMTKNYHVAIWITAAVFSLFHGEIFAFLPRFVLGAALGYLFYYGGSLWYNVTAHFLNNAAAIILFYFAANGKVDMDVAENSLNAPWYLAFIGLAIAVALLYVFFMKPKFSKKSF